MSWRDLDLNRLFTLGVDRRLESMGTSYRSAVLFLMMAEVFGYRSFLEIGTSAGYVSMVMGRYYELRGGGVVHTCDPDPINRIGEEKWEKAEVKYFHMTSDEYFAQLPAEMEFDLIFIDGCRYPDYLIRDTDNSLKHLSGFGTLIYHDPITLPGVAKFIYDELRRFGEFDFVFFPHQTGVVMVRRSEKAEWLELTKSLYPDHGYVMEKGWVDLKELITHLRGA